MRWAALLALIACSKSDAPKPTATPSYLPIISDEVAVKLGPVGFVLAVDLKKLDLGRIAGLIPDQLGCVRELIAAADSAVVAQGDKWEGFVTGLPEIPTKRCVDSLAPMLGFTARTEAGAYRIDGNDIHAALVWKGNIVTISEPGEDPRGGDPPGVIIDLAGHVPRDALGWIVSSGITNFKVKSLVAWFTTTATTWTFTVDVESIEAGAAKPWLEKVVAGFTEAATQKGAKVDPTWFTITSESPTRAHLVAAVPVDALAPKP